MLNVSNIVYHQLAIFDASPSAQALIDPIGDSIIMINPKAAALFWSTPETLTGQAFSQFFAGLEPKLVVFTQEILDKHEAWTSDLILRSKDGQQTRAVEIKGSVIVDEGRIYLLVQIEDKEVIDKRRDDAAAHQHYLSGISQWRRIEKVFQEIERDNQLILSAAGEGIYGVDGNGNTTFVNPAAEEMLGWSSDELVGREIHSLIHHTHTCGSEYKREDCPIYAAFCDGIVHRVTNEVFFHKNGQAIPVEYTSTPIKDNGHLVGAVVIFRDVTEQRNSEKQLIAALEEIEHLKQKLEQENAYLQEEIKHNFDHQHIVGKSSAIQNVIQQIDLVAKTNATVLITGESGTGKELIARAVHEASDRSGRPLIRVNCAAIPHELFESEFFGHIKGAFTGAINNRIGRFELADGGTLFLDEVGEIPLELQSKLLRVLQEGQFERVGEGKTRNVNVRVIAATNQNLKKLSDDKLFREDLYFRLNVFPIESAPLRKRNEDIPLLSMHFLEKSCKKMNKPGLKISIAQMDILSAYHWPGNIRELENIIERQVIVCQNEFLTFNDLITDKDAITTSKHTQTNALCLSDQQRKQQLRQDIMTVLETCQGKIYGQDGAAALMGLKPTTLASRIKKYNIDCTQFKNKKRTPEEVL